MADDSTITRERSAGVVVYRRDLLGRREYLLLDYGGHWDFAKGHVEAGESDRMAAERELFEETGIRCSDLHEAFCREITYVFRARGRVISKTVVFFVAQTALPTVRLSREHCGFAWLGMEDAMKKLTYAGPRDVLRFADVFLAQAV